MNKKDNNTKTERTAAKALSPLIKFAAKNRGTVTKVADRLSELAGRKVHRQLVEKWLHEKPEIRTEPLLGMGLLLMKVQSEICGTNVITFNKKEPCPLPL